MAGSYQTQNKDYIVFSEFEGMNTQAARHDLEEKEAAWMENLQPIGKNNLVSVPNVATALASLASRSETITRMFYFNYQSGTDYVIAFCTSGAAYAITNPGGVITKFANAGTFSTSPDVTQWGTERILIADPIAGYSTWDTMVFSQYGGISPNIQVTAGGTGYTTGATVSFSGGSGSGATATATVVGGVVTAIVLTNAGTGYVAADSVTVTITPVSGGSGATATAHVWPQIMPNPNTLAVFQGRVFLAQTNVLTYTGTGASYAGVGYDDFISGDASGSFTIQDADLVHQITALRALNNYLFIIGDNSVKQIGNLSVSGSATNFTVVTLSSDQGTEFRDTVVSYNRLVIFSNQEGVYAVFGSSVEKISDKMDGVFRLTNFTQKPCASVCDINNIHCFLLLMRYEDPISTTRSLILGFMNKKWFVMSQGASLKYITTAIVEGVSETFGTSGPDITQILAEATADIDITLETSLTSHGTPYLGKSMGRYAVAQNVGGNSTLNLEILSERAPSQNFPYTATTIITFVNNIGGALQFVNNTNQNLFFTSNAAGFLYKTGNTGGVAGVYLGSNLTGTVSTFALNSIMLEYEPAAIFGSEMQNIGG